METLSVIYWHFLLKNQHCCTQKTKQGKSRHHRASNMDWGHFKALFLSLWSSNFPSQKWKKKLLTLNEPRFPIFHSVNMLAWQKIILSSCILWFGAKKYFNNTNTYIYLLVNNQRHLLNWKWEILTILLCLKPKLNFSHNNSSLEFTPTHFGYFVVCTIYYMFAVYKRKGKQQHSFSFFFPAY